MIRQAISPGKCSLLTLILLWLGVMIPTPARAGEPGTQKWAFSMDYAIWQQSPALADDTVYITNWHGELFAIDPATGDQKWMREMVGYYNNSPAIGPDGTIYTGGTTSESSSLYSHFYAWKPNGDLKWTYELENHGDTIDSSAAIGPDGSIYFGTEEHGRSHLVALDSRGKVKWKWDQGSGTYKSSPAIGRDGTIYFGGAGFFYALHPDGTKKWEFPTGAWVPSSPAIGQDGTIYVGCRDNKVYAVDPQGHKKWEFPTGGYVDSSPAIGPDGTIYVGSCDKKLYALNPADGKKKWEYATLGLVISSPAVAADGTVMVGSDDGWVYAVDPVSGEMKWNFMAEKAVESSPVIGADGTVYIGEGNGTFYAIFSNSGGLANSPWPMFRHDVRHTGNLFHPFAGGAINLLLGD
jgi:outer membrane protein assembly factor BamB